MWIYTPKSKTILVAIKPENPTQKSPFSVRETRVMLEKVQQEYPDLITDICLIKSGQIEEILEALQPKYKPLLWGTSERRLKDYVLQLDYIKKKSIPLRLDKGFKLVELPAFVKSEDVVNSIVKSDFAEFKKLVPTSIASEFFNLQKELEKSVSEEVKPVSKFSAIFENQDIVADVIDSDDKEEDITKEDI